jgi:small redox-active disulfide protein 2
MLSIKVLGSGCANCQRVEQIASEVVREMAIEARIDHVRERSEFGRYGLLYTPGLVVNEKLVCGGRIPTKAEVTSWMMTALEQSG